MILSNLRFPIIAPTLLGLSLSSWDARAQATNTTMAQGLFDEAKVLMAANRSAEACPKLEESQRLDPGTGTLLNLARCYENVGRLASAWSTYLDASAAAKGAGNVERAKKAREKAASLAPRIAKLRIDVPEATRVPGLEVSRDGVPLNAPVWGSDAPADEGEHLIEAKAPDYLPFAERVLVKGEGATVVFAIPKLDPVPPPPPPPPPPVIARPEESPKAAAHEKPAGLPTQRVLALTAGGVGVAGVVVGSIFGLQAMSKANRAEETCDGPTCSSPGGAEAGNDAHDAGTVATVGMIVGAVGIGAGLVLWFSTPAESTTRIGLGADRVFVRGAF